MNARGHTRRRRHPLRRALGVAAAAGLVALAFAGASAWSGYRAWSAQAAAVAETRPGGPVTTSVLPFRYRGRTRFLEVAVSADEIAAARRLPTGEVFAQPGPVRDAYLRTLVATQSRSHLVDGVARQLRDIRASLSLDCDEYVELMAASVQAIPYGRPESAFQLPVVSLATGRGVCIDRSLLLAALLVHEGYDAGLWTLSSRDHVAVALRGAGRGYQGSGYTYIETTRRAYVGEVPEQYALMTASEQTPRLVVLGRGIRYGADAETELIVDEQRRAERTARDLGIYRTYLADAVGSWRETYALEARRAAEADALAAELERCVDDRRLAFTAMEDLNDWAEPGERYQ